jgi:hypothetical protein
LPNGNKKSKKSPVFENPPTPPDGQGHFIGPLGPAHQTDVTWQTNFLQQVTSGWDFNNVTKRICRPCSCAEMGSLPLIDRRGPVLCARSRHFPQARAPLTNRSPKFRPARRVVWEDRIPLAGLLHQKS